MASVNMRLEVMTQERPDKWAARIPAFGFTVYGATEDEAKEQTHGAVSALLQSFASEDEVRSFLTLCNVNYTINDETPEWRRTPSHSLEVELAIA